MRLRPVSATERPRQGRPEEEELGEDEVEDEDEEEEDEPETMPERCLRPKSSAEGPKKMKKYEGRGGGERIGGKSRTARRG